MYVHVHVCEKQAKKRSYTTAHAIYAMYLHNPNVHVRARPCVAKAFLPVTYRLLAVLETPSSLQASPVADDMRATDWPEQRGPCIRGNAVTSDF
jgi:hypothetical protein